jgi:hypothetical protein
MFFSFFLILTFIQGYSSMLNLSEDRIDKSALFYQQLKHTATYLEPKYNIQIVAVGGGAIGGLHSVTVGCKKECLSVNKEEARVWL